MSLTDLQFRLMDRIAHDDYNTTNGATPTDHTDVNCWLWADEFAKDLGISEKACGGVLTSLNVADYIRLDKQPKRRGQPDESSVWFTEAGFKVWKEARDKMEAGAAGPFPLSE